MRIDRYDMTGFTANELDGIELMKASAHLATDVAELERVLAEDDPINDTDAWGAAHDAQQNVDRLVAVLDRLRQDGAPA